MSLMWQVLAFLLCNNTRVAYNGKQASNKEG